LKLPHSMKVDSKVPERPEGRVASKRRRSNACADSESSRGSVEMLRKIHERGQNYRMNKTPNTRNTR
jgi:hypothetical protein